MQVCIWSSHEASHAISSGRIIRSIPFQKDSQVRCIADLEKGLVISQEQALFDEFSRSGEVLCNKQIRSKTAVSTHTTLQFILSQIPKLHPSSQQALVDLALSRLSGEGKEKIAIHVLGLHEDLTKLQNVLFERLRELMLLYTHEAAHMTNEQLLKGMQAFENTGMEFDEKDSQMLASICALISQNSARLSDIDSYLDFLIKSQAPNLHAIAGHMLAARLIALAGSIEKLARSPASRIQLLGAEKALFRHMKGKTLSPKHGVILMHPLIQQTPREKRGKMARLLAAKISMAAKIDFFSGTDKSKQMQSDLQNSAKNL